MNPLEYLDALGEWILSNLHNILLSVIAVVVGYLILKATTKQILRLKDEGRLEQHLAYTLNRIAKWIIALAVLSVILSQFGITLGVISGLLTVLGGTIIGFAAINTIGNTIAGLIVMTSRPFRVGDRIFFNGQFADVVAIELIYTKMRTLDNVLVSVPNQELLKGQIDNYGKERTIRRQVRVSVAFDCDSAEIERVLLEAATNVSDVLKEPRPYVWITNFLDYAVEYTLFAFTNEIEKLTQIDAELHKSILDVCKRNKVDISTPLLLRQLHS